MRRSLILITIAFLAIIESMAMASADTPDVFTPPSANATSDGKKAVVNAADGPSGGGEQSKSRGGTVACSFLEVGEEAVYQPGFGVLPKSLDPVTELQEGIFYLASCSENGDPLYVWRVLQHVPGEPPISALALANQAYGELEPVRPSPMWNPEGTQLAGFATWLWVDDVMWDSFDATASIPGLTVTATATPTEVTWDPGDGSDPIVCDGPGTPYNKNIKMKHQRTDCRHVYQYYGVYQGSATVTWEVEWSATNGDGGVLTPIPTTTDFEMAVGDREAVGR